ncbi:hypothetical protein QBC35DRAFT_271532 [Podospora australis]|uniref:Uncharacterized protein n=1 Tax=Podospora australis TaxID=1536484 RepID=A0AAN6WQL8_9PEZI|nr:hypothetical protein QBC35DRAFT_271532 [Podospora australis]
MYTIWNLHEQHNGSCHSNGRTQDIKSLDVFSSLFGWINGVGPRLELGGILPCTNASTRLNGFFVFSFLFSGDFAGRTRASFILKCRMARSHNYSPTCQISLFFYFFCSVPQVSAGWIYPLLFFGRLVSGYRIIGRYLEEDTFWAQYYYSQHLDSSKLLCAFLVILTRLFLQLHSSVTPQIFCTSHKCETLVKYPLDMEK